MSAGRIDEPATYRFDMQAHWVVRIKVWEAIGRRVTNRSAERALQGRVFSRRCVFGAATANHASLLSPPLLGSRPRRPINTAAGQYLALFRSSLQAKSFAENYPNASA